MIWIQNQLVGAKEGDQMTLECHSEAYPKSINYWTRENGDIISHGKSISRRYREDNPPTITYPKDCRYYVFKGSRNI